MPIVSIEGLDLAGKTTLINLLKERKPFPEAKFFKVPSQKIEFYDKMTKTERKEYIINEIDNINKEEGLVITDRGLLSLLAYESCSFRAINTFLKREIRLPDIIIFLHVQYKTVVSRIKTRRSSELTKKDLELLDNKHYVSMVSKFDSRYFDKTLENVFKVQLNTSENSIEKIYNNVVKIIKEKIR